MNIILVGKTGSGKTTIRDWISDNLRYDKIVTYTTRPPRPHEVNGEDYNFVEPDVFEMKNLILKTRINGNDYGVLAEDLNRENIIMILDPTGVRELRDRGYNFKSFMIECPTYLRYKRCLDRGDDEKSVLARIGKELYDFDGFVPDFVIDNSADDFMPAVISILEKIREVADCSRLNYTK